MYFSSHSETLSMKQESFRDVLSQFIERDLEESRENASVEANAHKTRTTLRAVHENPFIEFTRPQTSRLKSSYPIAKPRTALKTVPVKKKPEIVIPLEKLSSPEQEFVQEMHSLGAENDFSEGISTERLKVAHRRLAKRLHPDLFKGDSRYFRRLQLAYEGLRLAVGRHEAAARAKDSNGLTGDNECASAPMYPRQDAA